MAEILIAIGLFLILAPLAAIGIGVLFGLMIRTIFFITDL